MALSYAHARPMLFQIPEALRLIGLTPEDLHRLDQAGITPPEAAFLYSDFKAGARKVRISPSKKQGPYDRHGSRYYSLLSP